MTILTDDTIIRQHAGGSVPTTFQEILDLVQANASVPFQELSELVTIAAATTTDTVIQIPAGAVVCGVSIRVTVAIPTAATFDYGVAGATTRYGTGIAVAAGTTYPGTDDSMRFYGSAASIRITPNLTPGTNVGRVRIVIHYYTLTPPAS